MLHAKDKQRKGSKVQIYDRRIEGKEGMGRSECEKESEKRISTSNL